MNSSERYKGCGFHHGANEQDIKKKKKSCNRKKRIFGVRPYIPNEHVEPCELVWSLQCVNGRMQSSNKNHCVHPPLLLPLRWRTNQQKTHRKHRKRKGAHWDIYLFTIKWDNGWMRTIPQVAGISTRSMLTVSQSSTDRRGKMCLSAPAQRSVRWRRL